MPEKEKVSEKLFYDLKKINKIVTSEHFVLIEAEHASKTTNAYVNEFFLMELNAETNEFTDRQLTKGLYKDFNVEWVPQTKKISFLSNRPIWKEVELPPQLWFLDIAGGEPYYLFVHPNGIKDYKWSNSGRYAALVIPIHPTELQHETYLKGVTNLDLEPDTIKDLAKLQKKIDKQLSDPLTITEAVYRRGTKYLKGKVDQLFLYDFQKNALKLITNHPRESRSPVFSSDDKTIYYLTRSSEDTNDTLTWHIMSYNLETEETVHVETTYGYEPTLIISPDGELLAATYMDPNEGSASNIRLKFIKIATKETFLSTEEWDSHILAPKFASANRLYFLSPQNGHVLLYEYNIESHAITRKVSDENYYITTFDILSDTYVIYGASSANKYFEAYLLNMHDSTIQKITDLNGTLLEKYSLGEYHSYDFEGVDGIHIQGWYLTPPNFDPNKKYPVVVEVHGGPHVMWSPHEPTMFHEFQYLANNGFIVWFSNPSGSDGYGFKFRRSLKGNWDRAADDVLKGLEKFMEQPFVDRNAIYLTGGSYGGWLTGWLVGNSTLFRAAVSQRGVYNLISMYGVTDIPIFNELEMGVRPWENLELYWKQSPIAYVENVQCPVLLIHSENDFRVPISQAEEYFVALKKFGKEVVFVRYPEDGHELSRSGTPSRRADRLKQILNWFLTH